MISLEVIFNDGSMNTFCYVRNFTKDTKHLTMSYGNYDIVINVDKIEEIRKLDFSGPGTWWTFDKAAEQNHPAVIYNGLFPAHTD